MFRSSSKLFRTANDIQNEKVKRTDVGTLCNAVQLALVQT
jgi:hypothetical protein